jgi:hypothetical protein
MIVERVTDTLIMATIISGNGFIDDYWDRYPLEVLLSHEPASNAHAGHLCKVFFPTPSGDQEIRRSGDQEIRR